MWKLLQQDPRHPANDKLYAEVPAEELPGGESLHMTAVPRVLHLAVKLAANSKRHRGTCDSLLDQQHRADVDRPKLVTEKDGKSMEKIRMEQYDTRSCSPILPTSSSLKGYLPRFWGFHLTC